MGIPASPSVKPLRAEITSQTAPTGCIEEPRPQCGPPVTPSCPEPEKDRDMTQIEVTQLSSPVLFADNTAADPLADIAPVTPIRPLNQRTLGQHGDQLIVPTYGRAALTPAVVHMSVGGFGRAHQLLYLDELAERRLTSDWGVVGVGLHQRHMKDALAPQDYLYTVVERSPDGERARVVGVMIDYHFAPDDPAAVLDRLADPNTRLVTLTITTSGYGLDPVTGEFAADDPDIRADLAHPDRPATV